MNALPLILSLLFWGSAFPGIRAGLQGFAPIEMAIFRFLIASLTLLLIAILKGVNPPRRADVPLLALAAFFSIPGYHVCLNVGERFVTASAASLILSTLPIWTIFWSRLFLGETFHPAAWIGVIMSFAGAAIIAIGEGQGLQFNPYVGFILGSALCGSIYTAIQKRLMERYPVFDFNCYIIWAGTAMLLPFSAGLIGAIKSAPSSAILAVVYLGIFPAALTFILWATVVKRMPVSRAVTFLYLIPVVATIIGWLWLDEVPSVLSLIGGLVILIGLVVSQAVMRKRTAVG